MTITRDTPVVNVPPRMSRAAFVAWLQSVGSPAASEAGAGWDAVVAEHVDPLFAAAVFWHESNAATNPAAVVVTYGTRNPGNCRSSRTGVGTLVSVPGKGSYVKYPNWTEGWRDLAHRLLDPAYVYAQAGATTPGTIIPIWAPADDGNDPAGYLGSVVSWMNQHEDRPVTPHPRVVVSAGHEHIGQITAEKIGQQSADALRGSTGAGGVEAFWTAPWADALVAGLRALGADAVRTDAIYHADIYGQHADLVVFGHCDGVSDPAHPQHCMAGAVISGGSTDATDEVSETAAKAWRAVYPARVGIPGDGPVTEGMTWYFAGAYRTPDSPAILIEHCILASSAGRRADAVSPDVAARADLAALAPWLGLGTPRDVEVIRRDPVTGFALVGGFLAYVEWLEGKVGADDALLLLGHPLTDERDEVGDDGKPLRVQWFERVRMEWHPGARPERWDVLLSRLGAEALAAEESGQA